MLFVRYVVKGEEEVGEGLTTRLWQVTVRKGACPPTPAHIHKHTDKGVSFCAVASSLNFAKSRQIDVLTAACPGCP